MPSERELIQQIQAYASRLALIAAEAPLLQRRWSEQARAAHDRQAAAVLSAHEQAVTAANAAHQQQTAAAAQTQARRVAAAETAHRPSMASAQAEYAEAVRPLLAQAAELIPRAGLLAAPWSDPRWAGWQPSASGSPLGGLRMGMLQEGGPWDRLELPALLPFVGGRPLFIRTTTAARSAAVQAVQSFLLRLVAAIPPGKLRFTFVDPVGLGQNAAPFMHLADFDDALVTARAWTEPHHIEQRLADLTEHMENVIQKYLRNQYADIEAYNILAGEVAEPYRVLVVFDFPANFSEQAARRLISVVQNGPRCGVYAVVLADPAKPLPHGFNLDDLAQPATVIAWQEGRWVWEDEDFRGCRLELDAPPPPELFNRILTAVGQAAKDAGRVEVPFARIAPPPAERWRASSLAGLRVPVGPAGARRLQHLELGQGTAQHVLVAGKTGSGKSTLLHVAITNLALTYSPDEVELYLIDFKKGVEFKPYAVHALPHARVVAIESEREFGLSVLQGLDAELKRRGDVLRGAQVDSLAAFRQKTGTPLPRILLLVDEFQEFFTEDDALGQQAGQVLDRLVRQGRAFGVHVVLGSQTLAGAYSLARSTIDQMAVRIALQCSEADSRLILADDNAAARLLSRPGEAIYNDANGRVEGNNTFQVAWLRDEERDAYLDDVRTLAQARGYRPARPQIVFEGNAPAQVENNQLLHDLLVGIAPAPDKGLRLHAWLGDPIAIKDPTAADFRRQSGANLLMVGQQDDAALGMLATAIVGLAAQAAAARFFVLDFSPTDSPHAGLFPRLAALLPGRVQVGRRRDIPTVVGELAAAVESRLNAEGAGGSGWPALFLVVYGLQRARNLRADDTVGYAGYSGYQSGDEPAPPPSPAQQLPTILREGPEVGVHTLVWCDTMANLDRTFDRRTLGEFELRVAFQMSENDSTSLIDTPVAGRLGPYWALFVSEEEGQSEKFRPYGVPPSSWLDWAGTRLA